MNSFQEFKESLLEDTQRVFAAASKENLSMTKFFCKKVVPRLLRGAKTGEFSIPDLDKERNAAAHKREMTNAKKMSVSLKEQVYEFDKRCLEQYSSIDVDCSVNEEKCLFGIRQASLLWQSDRLTYESVTALLEELNDIHVSEDMLGEHIDVNEFDVPVRSRPGAGPDNRKVKNLAEKARSEE